MKKIVKNRTSKNNIIVSIDAMGGDDAPQMVIAGLNLVAKQNDNIEFLIFGDEKILKELIDSYPALKNRYNLVHTTQIVKADDKPVVALRTAKKSSMRLAIDAVKHGEADCVVSAGNTGALMAMSLISLRTINGIDRPAIVTSYPTIRGSSAMLDLGANVVCNYENLVQFAVMGEVFAKIMLGVKRPSVALLNVGSEDGKGHPELQLAYGALSKASLEMDFYGFVEGDDIAKGTVDVVVTDGFSGNIALKTAEGMSKLFTTLLKKAFSSSLMAKMGYVLTKKAMDEFKDTLDPRRYNGAVLIGLSKVCVKSHGGTDAFGFSNAINVAVELVKQDFVNRVKEDIELIVGINEK